LPSLFKLELVVQVLKLRQVVAPEQRLVLNLVQELQPAAAAQQEVERAALHRAANPEANQENQRLLNLDKTHLNPERHLNLALPPEVVEQVQGVDQEEEVRDLPGL
jgi:hypothetical protein